MTRCDLDALLPDGLVADRRSGMHTVLLSTWTSHLSAPSVVRRRLRKSAELKLITILASVSFYATASSLQDAIGALCQISHQLHALMPIKFPPFLPLHLQNVSDFEGC